MTSLADDISLMSSSVQQFQRLTKYVAVDIHRMSSPANSHFQTSMFMPTPAQLLRLHSVMSNTIQILVFLLRHVESGSLSFCNINDKSYCIPILAWFNLRVVCTRHCALTTHVESRLLLHCCMVRILFVSSTARHRAQSTIPRHTSLLTRHLFPGRLRPNFRSSAAVILVAWYSCRLLVFNQAISK